MALVRYCVTVIASLSDETVYSAIVPSWELERVINHAENKFGTDCYMTVAPVISRGKTVVFVDNMNFHHHHEAHGI